MKTLKKSKGGRSQIVHRILKQAILDTAILPGTKLSEDSVGESIGVSRTVVKEALVRLSEEGLVEMRPNKGAWVARPAFEEGYDLYSIRFALERLVVEKLTGRLGEEECKALEAHIRAEEEAKSGDRKTSIRLAGEFHSLLATMTGNAVLARYINELVSRTSLVATLYARPHSTECSICEHAEILSGIKEGNVDKAVGLMMTHLQSTVDRALMAPGKSGRLQDILAPYAREAGIHGE
jgi:DNA-binding GntR family transcriptional regulator